jgi:uncharacterized protein YjeT (DUF2065 family)
VKTTSTLCLQDLVLGLLVLVFGIVVFLWPKKIQEINVRWHEGHPDLAALNPFSAWIRTPDATLVVRASGLVLIFFSLVVFYFAWKACSG